VRLGAHVSAAGGIDRSIDRAVEMGAETIQIFGSPPQSLIPPKHTSEAIAAFKTKAATAKISPIFLHAPYLVNLATGKPDYLKPSIDTLKRALELAADLGAQGVIFHTGSSKEVSFEDVLPQVVGAIKEIISARGEAELIIENSAGGGGTVGDTPQEIGEIITKVGSGRVKTCLDFQHAFATGYDLRSEKGTQEMLADWDREIGLDNLVAIHANDSKVPLGSRRDRHANIGEGEIGKSGFSLLKKNEVLAKVPWIIEVPGFADKGPDRENLEILGLL
jgi:deoxyribonuclease IV